MVGVPIGNDVFAVNSALEIVRDGEAGQLAHPSAYAGQTVGEPHRHQLNGAADLLH